MGTKTKRERIRAKTDGHCAYCGIVLADTGWHIDHIEATWRNRPERGGDEHEANLVAACARCNRWKSVLSPGEFRAEIAAQVERLYRDVPGFRLALDYGVIRCSNRPVTFHAEPMLTGESEGNDDG